MPTLDDVYLKFGFAAEAAQLLETELGTALMLAEAIDKDLLTRPDPKIASEVFGRIDRMTLGQIIRCLRERSKASVVGREVDDLESLLTIALRDRNRLQHSFYREHNFRRNSEEGRAIMLADLESIHTVILDAYKAVMLLSGKDLDAPDLQSMELPTRHLSISGWQEG